MITNERIVFRVFSMGCCGQLLCWVNPRYPSHCPECGVSVYPQIKGWAVIVDDNAHLKYDTDCEVALG